MCFLSFRVLILLPVHLREKWAASSLQVGCAFLVVFVGSFRQFRYMLWNSLTTMAMDCTMQSEHGRTQLHDREAEPLD